MGQGKDWQRKEKGLLQKFLDIWREDRQRAEKDEYFGGACFATSSSSSVICQPLPHFSAETGLLLADKWPPYGLLPLLTAQGLGGHAVSWDCTPYPTPKLYDCYKTGRQEDHSPSAAPGLGCTASEVPHPMQ